MRKALGLIAVASVALAVWLSQVLAEDAAVPNLVGTPVLSRSCERKGIGKDTLTIRVTDQDGALFKAEKAWETPGTVGKVGSKVAPQLSTAPVFCGHFRANRPSVEAIEGRPNPSKAARGPL